MTPNPKPKDADADLLKVLDHIPYAPALPCECGDWASMPDTYALKHQAGPPVWRPDGTCSWCGSLSPEYVLLRLRQGTVSFDRTTKNYKGYLRAATASSPPIPSPSGKFYLWHFNAEQVAELNRLIGALPL